MSIFQCAKCGCAENSALTDMYHAISLFDEEVKKPQYREALLSYKKILGLAPDEPFRKVCSACSPIWYDDKGAYGVGKNPNPSTEEGDGIWHGKFERVFLPKGKFRTDRYGNLEHIETGDTDIDKYKLEKEDGT